MPQCHTPFLFPICPSAPWHPSISRWRHGDGAPRGAFIRLGVNTPGLYERCRLTEQHSPPPHLDKGWGPRTSTVHTHILAWPPTSTNEHKENQHQSEGQPQDVGESRRETLKAQQHTAHTDVSLICLMFSMLWKCSQSNHRQQSNSLFCVV